MLPDFERADQVGEFWSYPESCTFAELLIDCEEDRLRRRSPRVRLGLLDQVWPKARHADTQNRGDARES